LEPLEANGIVFKNGSRVLVLVALDALYGGEVGDFLARELDVDRECVLILGSHTHFAPGVDRDIAGLGETLATYLEEVAAAIAGAVRSALHVPDALVSGGVAEVEGLFVNRRRPLLGGRVNLPVLGSVLPSPNFEGSIDDKIRALVLTRPRDSSPVAVIWGASCHPVCSPDPLSMSACFPGVVRSAIRDHFRDAELPVLFVQGFSGDVRPNSYSRKVPLSPIPFLFYLFGGARRFRQQTPQEYAAWCNSLADFVRSALSSA
jgi:hypothetical protein